MDDVTVKAWILADGSWQGPFVIAKFVERKAVPNKKNTHRYGR